MPVYTSVMKCLNIEMLLFYFILCSVASSNCALTGVKLLKKFGSWSEDQNGIGKRMPYLSTDDRSLLATSDCNNPDKYGTVVGKVAEYRPARWIGGASENPGIIWYWIKESSTLLKGEHVFTVRVLSVLHVGKPHFTMPCF